MQSEKESFKILMFPWLAHGHIFPFLELSKRLSKSFTIYLLSTKVNLDSIKSSIGVKLVELKMPSSPQLPPHLHTTKNLPSNLLPSLMKAFQESTSSFTETIDAIKPDLVVFDLFQPWAPKIASSKCIPSVYFSAGTYFHHLHTMGSGATFPFPAITLPRGEMDSLLSRLPINLKDADDDFAFGVITRSTDIVLTKGCRYVEEKYVDYFSFLSKKKIVCTGPLISDSNEDGGFEGSEIVKWLDGKDDGSTLYISFGSECFLSKQQIGEIAKGLLLCDVNFLWVIRFPLEGGERKMEDELPQGFLETVKERGLVVQGWAPQAKLLGHGSTGGFVSHCGWSSITESMYFGAPVIALPMNVEQPMNAKFMVELGVGVKSEREEDGVYKGEEIVKAINKVMVEKAFYEGLRSRARRLSESIKEKEEEEVNEVAEELHKICGKNKK